MNRNESKLQQDQVIKSVLQKRYRTRTIIPNSYSYTSHLRKKRSPKTSTCHAAVNRISPCFYLKRERNCWESYRVRCGYRKSCHSALETFRTESEKITCHGQDLRERTIWLFNLFLLEFLYVCVWRVFVGCVVILRYCRL